MGRELTGFHWGCRVSGLRSWPYNRMSLLHSDRFVASGSESRRLRNEHMSSGWWAPWILARSSRVGRNKQRRRVAEYIYLRAGFCSLWFWLLLARTGNPPRAACIGYFAVIFTRTMLIRAGEGWAGCCVGLRRSRRGPRRLQLLTIL